MKALTLWQPWASLVILGYKKIETRSWSTVHRGKLAIHAAKQEPKSVFSTTARIFSEEAKLAVGMCLAYYGAQTFNELPRGCVLGEVDLVLCEPSGNVDLMKLESLERVLGDYSLHRFAWHLEKPEHYHPFIFPVRGYQRLWNWEKPNEPIY